jgi:hypothetical protein
MPGVNRATPGSNQRRWERRCQLQMTSGHSRSLTRFALVVIVITAVFTVALTWLARVMSEVRFLVRAR